LTCVYYEIIKVNYIIVLDTTVHKSQMRCAAKLKKSCSKAKSLCSKAKYLFCFFDKI